MQPLPKNYMEDCLESYIYKHTTKSQIIYIVVLLALIACIVALPLIYVDVTVQNAGMVRPIDERTEIRASMSELIDSVYVRNGATVLQGDTILRLRTGSLQTRKLLLTQQMDNINQQLTDLNRLTRGTTPANFASGVRMQENALFIRRKNELETMLERAQNDYTRNRQLFDRGVISPEEYEQFLFARRRAENELESFINNQLSVWKIDQNTLTMSRAELQTAFEQLDKERELYYVISPVSGTIQQFTGLYRGNSLLAGQTLGVIIPSSTLFAEVFVSPRNIGFIHVGMPVNIRVESFNHNQWGTISGEVYQISSDVYFDGNSQGSFYRVKTKLHRDYLTLRNGRKGYLKTGMTISAHFMLTRRSLFHLLYQRVDYWINPTQVTS